MLIYSTVIMNLRLFTIAVFAIVFTILFINRTKLIIHDGHELLMFRYREYLMSIFNVPYDNNISRVAIEIGNLNQTAYIFCQN